LTKEGLEGKPRDGRRKPGASGTKGRASVLLEWRILETTKHYARLTVRQLYYIMVSRHGYKPSRNFYKLMDYHLTKM